MSESDDHVVRRGDRFKYMCPRRFSQSELDPGTCDSCGEVLSVAWVALEVPQSGRHEVLTRRCMVCSRPWSELNVWLAVSVDGEGAITVWQRASIPIKCNKGSHASVSDVLASRIKRFGGLAAARKLEVEKPGKWRLQAREDGTLWAPWSPAWSTTKDGAQWPFRRGNLRKARFRRSCTCCRAGLQAGDIVWRPDVAHGDRVGSRDRHGWTKTLISTVLVCDSCADKARRGFIPARLTLIRGGA